MRLKLALGASALIIAVAGMSALAGERKKKSEEAETSGEMIAAKKQTKQIVLVQNEAELKAAFDLAARDGGAAELEVSCHPPDHEWCAGGFQDACAKNDGGLSTNPDGSITCSIPD